MKEKTEEKIQQEIVMWFKNNHCLSSSKPKCVIFSVPNDSINPIETIRKVNTGLLKGVSDLIVLIPGKALFVEVKNAIGKQSDRQVTFENSVEELGFEYHLVRSLEHFKFIITGYL